jgi:GT2 family glycosyltransferase
VHVRLERQPSDPARFGKCAAVNAAVRRARELDCDHLLFTDGDCLPAPTLLDSHLRAARPGRFVAGGVVRLSRALSDALGPADVEAGRFSRGIATGVLLPVRRRRGDKPLYALPRPLGLLLDLVNPRRTPWKGGNSSCSLSDFERVNGYDERFGWGSEDKELGERLENAGLRGFSLRYSAPVFHLWHERPYVRAEVIAHNRALLAETRRTGAAWTAAGLRR